MEKIDGVFHMKCADNHCYKICILTDTINVSKECN